MFRNRGSDSLRGSGEDGDLSCEFGHDDYNSFSITV